MATHLSIQDNGFMCSSFFHGTSGVWLNIPADKTTTIGEVLESLEQEIYTVWDHIEYVAEYHNFPISELDKSIKSQLDDIKEFCKDKLDKKYDETIEFSFADLTLEENPDIEELPNIIFTIEFV